MKKLLFPFLIIPIWVIGQEKRKDKAQWIADKNFEELSSFVSSINDSQKTKLYLVSFKMTKMFDSIKALHLEDIDKKSANKSVFVYRKNEYKNILSEKQFDEFLMMEEEKLLQWRNKNKDK